MVLQGIGLLILKQGTALPKNRFCSLLFNKDVAKVRNH